MEDHNRLLHSTDSGSGPERHAMGNRGFVAAICVLVALGCLLCAGRESLAQQPTSAPEASAPEATDQPADHGQSGAPNAEPPAQTQPEKTAIREAKARAAATRAVEAGAWESGGSGSQAGSGPRATRTRAASQQRSSGPIEHGSRGVRFPAGTGEAGGREAGGQGTFVSAYPPAAQRAGCFEPGKAHRTAG